MATMSVALGGRRNEERSMALGTPAALAESAWMNIPLAADVLEPARAIAGRSPLPQTKKLTGLLTREFSIAQATVILMASFLASALLGMVRQILFNSEFGAGNEASAYYAAFRLPDTLFSLIAGGALSSAMIPVLLSTAREEGEAAAARLTNLVLSILVAVFAVVVLAGELFTPFFVGSILAPGFDASTSALTVALTRIMLIQPVILAVGSVATAVLNGRNQFLLTAISVASHNITLIAGLLATRFIPSLGIYGPTLGVVAGAILQVLILLPGILGDGLRFQPAWNLRDARLREVIRLLIPNGLAVGVGYAGFIVDTSFASQARETAALAALSNAWLLVGLPISLLGQAVGQSAFPRLAAHAADGAWPALRRTVLQALGTTIALAIPAVLFLYFFGHLIIHILFEHGKYNADDGALTYSLLVAYALALPAYVATEVVVRGLIALRDTRTPLLTNTVQVAGRILILALFIGSLGAVTVPIAYGGMAALETVALTTILLISITRRARGAVAPVPAESPAV